MPDQPPVERPQAAPSCKDDKDTAKVPAHVLPLVVLLQRDPQPLIESATGQPCFRGLCVWLLVPRLWRVNVREAASDAQKPVSPPQQRIKQQVKLYRIAVFDLYDMTPSCARAERLAIWRRKVFDLRAHVY